MRTLGQRGRRWACALLVVLLGASVPRRVTAEPSTSGPAITARAAVVMSAGTGELIWSRNADQQFQPASTTKIMTSILALESGRLGDYLTVSRYAAAQPPSKINLRAGQQARLEDLVYALLLNSANDGAVVIAEGLGGSVGEFAEQMNVKARQIGARRTQFRNPNGLPDDDHLTTARDLALMLRYALANPDFRRIAGTPSTEIEVLGVGPRRIALHTHNRLLSGYFVPVFGKTGYTRAAGRCFVGAAEFGGRQVIVVALGSSNLWGDTRRLIEYGLGIDAREAVRLQLAVLERGEFGEGDVVGAPPGARRSARLHAAKRHRRSHQVVTPAVGASSAPASGAVRARASKPGQAVHAKRATTTTAGTTKAKRQARSARRASATSTGRQVAEAHGTPSGASDH